MYEDAIHTCSEVLANRDNVQARHWRGVAYHRTKQLKDALQDLKAVADSDDLKLRTSAAIQILQIYLGQKDFKSVLDVIDEHRYLFDPNWAGFTYETRCRARMELGNLQEALDDCTAALKFASSMPAQRLRQELTERLAKQKPGAVAAAPRSERADGQSPAHARAPDKFPNVSFHVIDDIKTKIRSAGFEPNGVAVVYDLEDWHQQFNSVHPYAKMLDLPMSSLKEAVEVLNYFAKRGLVFAARADRPQRFHVVVVDDRARDPKSIVFGTLIWRVLGISIAQAHSVAEMQEMTHNKAVDIVVVAETLPELIKTEIHNKITDAPVITMSIPNYRASGSSEAFGQAPPNESDETAKDAILDFDDAMFDALQKIIPTNRPVYVSFATM